MSTTRRSLLAGLGATAGSACLPTLANAAAAYGQQAYAQPRDPGYTMEEIVGTGHQFFGTMAKGLAETVEYMFQRSGRPNGYILGQEGSGAFIAGLRYGEGTLTTKNVGNHKVYWQGPSIGWDMGGNGDRTMILVYNLPSVDAMYRHYAGVNGSAYLVAGLEVSVYANQPATVAPIRTGIGARLGVNVGYLKFTRQPTWNPF